MLFIIDNSQHVKGSLVAILPTSDTIIAADIEDAYHKCVAKGWTDIAQSFYAMYEEPLPGTYTLYDFIMIVCD